MQPKIVIASQPQSVLVLSAIIHESIELDHTLWLLIQLPSNQCARDYLKKKLTLQIKYRGHMKSWCGIVTQVNSLSLDKNKFELILRPSLLNLMQSVHSRSFVNITVVEIVHCVVMAYQECHVDFSRLKRVYESISYIVQYQETDYEFLRRLMSAYGIFYYYDADTIILIDDVTGYSVYPEPLCALVLWRRQMQYTPSSISTIDKSQQQTARLNITQQQIHYAFYPSTACNQLQRDLELSVHYQRFRQQASAVFFVGDYLGLGVGSSFFRSGNYVIKEAFHQFYFHRGVLSYSQQCYAMPADFMLVLPYLAAPQLDTTLTARVSAIDASRLLRVKLQYSWDENQNASPWCQVRQYWCGLEYGAQFMPQLGDSVIVGFVDGYLAKPVVLGKTVTPYNGFKFGEQQNFVALKADALQIYAQGAFKMKCLQQLIMTAGNKLTFKFSGGDAVVIQALQASLMATQQIRFQVGESILELSPGCLKLDSKEILFNS